MTAHRIRSRADAVRWRADQSGVVVFTNGVFDLLHPGHIHILESAGKLGDALVVGINDDESAAALGKRPARPVCPGQDRARVVAALNVVDCVVLFQEPTPSELIAQLRPDVLVKGTDYAGQDIPGAAWVETNGGRVEFVPLLPDHSSTNIVERIRRGTS